MKFINSQLKTNKIALMTTEEEVNILIEEITRAHEENIKIWEKMLDIVNAFILLTKNLHE
jgi:hypothetical protein